MATKMCFRVNENKVFDEEIVTFTYVEDDMGFITFEKAKDGIIAEMENERKTVALEDYISKMLNEANVQIKYGD